MKRRKRCAALLLVLVNLGCWRLLGQADGGLTARLNAAARLNSLDQTGTSGWHLKLAVQLYTMEGKVKDEGTIEEWWFRPGSKKTVFALSTYQATFIESNGGSFATPGSAAPTYFLGNLLEQVVHPMPTYEPNSRV